MKPEPNALACPQRRQIDRFVRFPAFTSLLLQTRRDDAIHLRPDLLVRQPFPQVQRDRYLPVLPATLIQPLRTVFSLHLHLPARPSPLSIFTVGAGSASAGRTESAEPSKGPQSGPLRAAPSRETPFRAGVPLPYQDSPGRLYSPPPWRGRGWGRGGYHLQPCPRKYAGRVREASRQEQCSKSVGR